MGTELTRLLEEISDSTWGDLSARDSKKLNRCIELSQQPPVYAMSNETKPLLSDEQIDGHELIPDKWAPSGHRLTFRPMTSGAVRDIYEAERTKLMAVLQVCADAFNVLPHTPEVIDALSQLKAIGVEPNK